MWFEDGDTNKRQKVKLEVAELKILRISLGVSRKDRIRNGYSRRTSQGECFWKT